MTMISDLDATLKALVTEGLPPTLAEQITVTFEAPDEDFPPSSVSPPAIDLFLYDVRENVDLRSNEWRLEREQDARAMRQRPPIRIDCSYLITAWPSDSAPNPAEDEHRLLGTILTLLLRTPTIPERLLRGSLRGQRSHPPTVRFQPGRLQSLGDFWQALGGRPKAALNYTVTIAVDVHAPEEVALVTEKLVKIRQGTGAGE